MLKRYIQIKHCPKVKKDQNSSIDITERTDPPRPSYMLILSGGNNGIFFVNVTLVEEEN